MNFLWTGGWDSTFRVIQLYKRGVTIQPIYVIDPGRKSTKKEMETIEELSKQIAIKFNNSNGKILQPIFINKNDIPKNRYLKVIFKLIRFFNKVKVGKQYYWLACLSKSYNNLEQCFHSENREQIISIHKLKEIQDETGGKNWVVNPKKMGFLKSELFKNTRFPLIYLSKSKMKEIAEKENFLDIMNKTWFCHRSEKKPCGECSPCKQYLADGFGYRVNY